MMIREGGGIAGGVDVDFEVEVLVVGSGRKW